MTNIQFDPNSGAKEDSGIFGLPYSEAESALVFLPVPWEVTTSYGEGTSAGPDAILKSSKQVDLYDSDILKPYEAGLTYLPPSLEISELNKKTKIQAQEITEAEGAVASNPELLKTLLQVNQAGERLNQIVYQETKRLLAAGKIVGIVGGDHSVPFGGFQAIAEKHSSFGILHFDAHSDTRRAYQGFTWSHASIMFNTLEKIPQVSKLVQVGIRDFCEEEATYCLQQGQRVSLFLDRDLQRRKFEGVSWGQLCREIVATLPNHVWISFDIDGLDPRFCPHTGTPVPGGLDFQEANYLIQVLVKSGRRIIGFDLNEVAPNLKDDSDEWDANVGSRLLYKLAGWTLVSQNLAKLQL